MKQTVLFAGNYNPPALHHRVVVAALAEHFDEVIVVPCGPYPHKPLTADTPPMHRAVMADLTFRNLPKTRVELFDLEAATFTSNAELERKFEGEGDLWHAVPAEWIAGGARAESFIHCEWHEGPRLWREAKFVVVHRPGEKPDAEDLPPHHRTVAVNYRDRSVSIRSRVVNHEPIEGLVAPAVEQYIKRHGLYQNAVVARDTQQVFASPRLLLHVDERNAAARELADKLRPQVAPDPELAVVLGGDGTMLHAIRQYWRLRIPFFGINTGHIGFLLNDSRPTEIRDQQLLLYQLPLLWVELELLDAPSVRGLAFNDAWVERASGQTAWMRISVDGRTRLSKVVADGVLVSTAAGSTSYARAMGAPPLPLNTPVQLLVGSNVLTPASWKCVVLPLTSEMLIETLDPVKRPLTAFIDGVPQAGVRSMRVRTSRIASAELAFLPQHNPAEKLAHLQFPV